MYLRAMSSSSSVLQNSDGCSDTPSSDRFKGIGGTTTSSKRNQYSLRAIGIMFLIIYGMLTTLYFLSSQSIMTFHKKAQLHQQQLQQIRKKNKQLSTEILSKQDRVPKGVKTTATKAIPLFGNRIALARGYSIFVFAHFVILCRPVRVAGSVTILVRIR